MMVRWVEAWFRVKPQAIGVLLEETGYLNDQMNDLLWSYLIYCQLATRK
jgi:hypothetical protein